jgi:hypothetical protein
MHRLALALLALASCVPPAPDASSERPRLAAQPPMSVGSSEIEFYLSIAFGREYGQVGDRLISWGETARIQLDAGATPPDVQEVDRVIADINGIGGRTLMRRVSKAGTLSLRFASDSEFPSLVPRSASSASAFTWVNFREFTITSGQITIRNSLEGQRRAHAIREELTQSLGLLNDTWFSSSSIFYQGPTALTGYSSLDSLTIWLHARTGRSLRGATEQQVRVQLQKQHGIARPKRP